MVIWVLGLSGSGKSTLAELLSERLRPHISNLVHVDGDQIRAVFDKNHDYSEEGREKNAERISKLVKFLSDQGVHVIVSVLSNYPEWLRWNRQNLAGYFEIFVKVDHSLLRLRDVKKIYRRADRGELKNVVGVDISFREPKNPDLVIENNLDIAQLKEAASLALRELGKKDGSEMPSEWA